MALFAIADLHLSLGADKPMDVFEGWRDYTSRLEKNWRAAVRDGDTVVVAGDISWGMKLEETEKDFAFLQSLPGRKLFIKGNHDYWWSTRKKVEEYLASRGFSSIELVYNNAVPAEGLAVCGTRGWLYNAETAQDRKIVSREVGRLNASLDDARRQCLSPLVFLHYPPAYDGMECREILDTLTERGIGECYFGHIHGAAAARKAPAGEYGGIVMHLISCDFLQFAPIRIK